MTATKPSAQEPANDYDGEGKYLRMLKQALILSDPHGLRKSGKSLSVLAEVRRRMERENAEAIAANLTRLEQARAEAVDIGRGQEYPSDQ